MNCLSCQTPLPSGGNPYHSACCRKLFGRTAAPKVSFATSDIPAEAGKLVGKMSISGVQPKLSVALRRGAIEVTPAGGTHILKPTPEAFPYLPENENLCMCLARTMGDETHPHGLLKLTDGRLAYIIRRFDRDKEGGKIHVEDFAQLLEKTDKYDGSVEQIGKFLKTHSSTPYIDTQKLFARVLFCFLIGNGDAHLKNFAMIRTPAGYQLSPAYDMVNSRLAMAAETDEMAIAINGRRNQIDMRDFESLADFLEINDKQLRHLLAAPKGMMKRAHQAVEASFLPADLKNGFSSILEERYRRLFRHANNPLNYQENH